MACDFQTLLGATPAPHLPFSLSLPTPKKPSGPSYCLKKGLCTLLTASRAFSLAFHLEFQWFLTTGGRRKAVSKGWQLGRWLITAQQLIWDWSCTQGRVAINLTHICHPYSCPLKVNFPKAHSHYVLPWIYDYLISKVNLSLPSGSTPKLYRFLRCSEQKQSGAEARLPGPSQLQWSKTPFLGLKTMGYLEDTWFLWEGRDEGEGDRMGGRKTKKDFIIWLLVVWFIRCPRLPHCIEKQKLSFK